MVMLHDPVKSVLKIDVESPGTLSNVFAYLNQIWVILYARFMKIQTSVLKSSGSVKFDECIKVTFKLHRPISLFPNHRYVMLLLACARKKGRN